MIQMKISKTGKIVEQEIIDGRLVRWARRSVDNTGEVVKANIKFDKRPNGDYFRQSEIVTFADETEQLPTKVLINRIIKDRIGKQFDRIIFEY